MPLPMPLNDPSELMGDSLPLAGLGLLPPLCDFEDSALASDGTEPELAVLDGAVELGVDEAPELGSDGSDDGAFDGGSELDARLGGDSVLLALDALAIDGDETSLVDTLDVWLDRPPELTLDSALLMADADDFACELSSLEGALELGTEDAPELSPDGLEGWLDG